MYIVQSTEADEQTAARLTSIGPALLVHRYYRLRKCLWYVYVVYNIYG